MKKQLPKVLLSTKPKWTCDILNGLKTWEFRKGEVPVGTVVYIYVTKDTVYLIHEMHTAYWSVIKLKEKQAVSAYNGTVVAKFTVDKCVDMMKWFRAFKDQEFWDILQEAHMTTEELQEYAGNDTKKLFAWHISNLEVFEHPKYLTDFKYPCEKKGVCGSCKYLSIIKKLNNEVICDRNVYKAPQSYCYVEERYGN